MAMILLILLWPLYKLIVHKPKPQPTRRREQGRYYPAQFYPVLPTPLPARDMRKEFNAWLENCREVEELTRRMRQARQLA